MYAQAQQTGGAIPYTVIREVSENFIHARFCEIVVSIYDGGNTIRFSDQGPGIPQKEKAQMPGFSSATDPMKQYIRGVGSGLPLVKEYLSFSHGRITIEDNLRTGAVVTISVAPEQDQAPSKHRANAPRCNSSDPHLTDREKDILSLLMKEGSLKAHGYQERPRFEPQHRTQNPQKP
ncbi:MAG: ATP-binding protein [Slackia sp.]